MSDLKSTDNSYTEKQSNINVTVITEYLLGQSKPEDDQYAFAYHITIENKSAQAVKLLTRHWIIVDSDQQQKEVQGPGVIGEQPRIEVNERYQYSSGVVLKTPIGTMQGSYQMVNDLGHPVEAPISPFLLAVPNTVN
jgi:ApaG protein